MLAADPQFRERFDREARTISQVEHPHIRAFMTPASMRARRFSSCSISTGKRCIHGGPHPQYWQQERTFRSHTYSYTLGEVPA
jgi:hypothetical protein